MTARRAPVGEPVEIVAMVGVSGRWPMVMATARNVARLNGHRVFVRIGHSPMFGRHIAFAYMHHAGPHLQAVPDQRQTG